MAVVLSVYQPSFGTSSTEGGVSGTRMMGSGKEEVFFFLINLFIAAEGGTHLPQHECEGQEAI